MFTSSDTSTAGASLPLPDGAPDLAAAQLRLTDGPASGVAGGATEEAPAAPHGPLILAIDDSPAVRTIVEYSFARAGLHVITCADGLEAIRALVEQRIAVPDLVLLDIGLPRMDGYEVAAVLRTNQAFATIPIIMLSGRDGIVDRMRSRLVGAATFVPKPFRPKELVALVCGYLGVTPGDSRGLPSAAHARHVERPISASVPRRIGE